MTAALAMCLIASVYDGDGPIRCQGDSTPYRLVVIQAPDYENSPPCRERPTRKGFVCSNVRAEQAKRSLAGFLRGPVLIQRCGQDRYGRVLVRASVNGHDAGQWQMAQGHAVARYRDACR